MLARPLLLALSSGLLASACSKSEPPPPAKPPAPKVAAAPAPVAPAKSEAEAIDEGLKERLARQEAAAKMFESNVLNPAPPRVPEPPKELAAARPAPMPAAQPPAPPKVAAAPPEVKPAPLAAATPAPASARSDPPQAAVPAPAPAVPSPAPRTDLAAARPSAAPQPQATRLVTKVDPDFPREAVVAGVDQGVVKARMTLDASGNVTRVEVLDANPRRVFDRAVVRALSQWRYSEGASGRTVDLEVAFRR